MCFPYTGFSGAADKPSKYFKVFSSYIDNLGKSPAYVNVLGQKPELTTMLATGGGR